ncbi:MAG: hypothetical protein HY566_01750 [Candidatus Kerfeldbacteria bacterium]|nr:hypothetical protein [Candidatus Kerfeldbacteria bacterium]
MKYLHFRSILAAFLVLATFGLATAADATHRWGSYHWARTANPFTLKLGDNLTAAWDSYLVTTSNDWSQSSILDTAIVPGGSLSARRCRATTGRAEICNYRYGNNGWLGVAQIWVTGDHITKGTVKVNDTYFSTSTYNTPAWRNLVLCQEVGHIFGLDHQDESFSNPPLGTCMDYSNDPNPNQHPNQHDYDMLEEVYAHLDSTTTVGLSAPSRFANFNVNLDLDNPAEWGRVVKRSVDGRISLYVREFGFGRKVFTHVFWLE